MIQGRLLREGRHLRATEDVYLIITDLHDRARLREALDVLMPAVDQAVLRRELLPSRAEPLRDLL